MMKNKKDPRRGNGTKSKNDVGKHLVPIVTRAARRRKRVRLHLKFTPLHAVILLGAMLCAYPLMMAGINAIGAVPSVGILAGLMICVGVMV